MRTGRSILALGLLLTGILFMQSCGKDDTGAGDISAAKEGSRANNFFDDVFKQVDYAARLLEDMNAAGKSLQITLQGCPSLSITPVDASFPKTLTLDYGQTNCIGIDTRERRGVIEAEITDWYRNTNCTITVTLKGYYVNNNLIEGTKIIVNKGRNQENRLHFEILVENGKVTSPENEITTWNSVRTNEWIEGEATKLNLLDDTYLITGMAGGKTSDGIQYSFKIITPLNIQIGCRWIREGVIEITQEDGPVILVDYGNGECDASAIATIQGIKIPFVML